MSLRRRGREGSEKIFEENMLKNFPNVGKEIVTQVQEAQRVPYRINLRRNMPRHILIKLTKTKRKERILKEAREKQQVTYKGNSICLTADLSAETLHNAMRLDISYKKKPVRNTNTWRLNKMFLNNQQVTEEIKREIKKTSRNK